MRTREIMRAARMLGRDHGTNAAGWWEQDAVGGRVTRGAEETASYVLRGIEDGDPCVFDSIPAPDLSGQWADGVSSRTLADNFGLDDERDPDGFLLQEACDEYEDAFNDACVGEIVRACKSAGGSL